MCRRFYEWNRNSGNRESPETQMYQELRNVNSECRMSDVGKSQTISYIRLTQVTYTVMCSLNYVCEIAGASSEGGS